VSLTVSFKRVQGRREVVAGAGQCELVSVAGAVCVGGLLPDYNMPEVLDAAALLPNNDNMAWIWVLPTVRGGMVTSRWSFPPFCFF
jgi:hypothetical protein